MAADNFVEDEAVDMKKWLKQKLAGWIWRDNAWITCVDQITEAIEKGRTRDTWTKSTLTWKFTDNPKRNGTYKITIEPE
jgi:hypothetical protein